MVMLVKSELWFSKTCGIKKFGDLNVYLDGQGQDPERPSWLRLPVRARVHYFDQSLIIKPDPGACPLILVVVDEDDEFNLLCGADGYTFHNQDSEVVYHFLHCYSRLVYSRLNGEDIVITIDESDTEPGKLYANYLKVPHTVYRWLRESESSDS